MRHITISDTVLIAIRQAIADGDNPLGIEIGTRRYGNNVRDIIAPAIKQAFRGMRKTEAPVMARAIEARLDKTRTIGNPQGMMSMDKLMAEVLAHHGLDPLLCTWISLIGGSIEMDDDENGRIAGDVDGSCGAYDRDNGSYCSLLRMGAWHQVGKLDVYNGIPDTITMNLIGEPLSRMVSHPVLDRWDLKIMRIDTFAETARTIRTSHRPSPIEMDDLLATGAALRI